MEQKYINQYNISFELLKEWAKNPIGRSEIRNRKKGIRLRVIGSIASIIIMVSGVFRHEWPVILMGVTFFAIFMSRLFYTPNRFLKKQYDLLIKVQKSNVITRTITFSDNIVINDGRTIAHYEYSEIIRISEDEKYFNLFLNADLGLRVRKDSFITGTCEDFRNFINSEI